MDSFARPGVIPLLRTSDRDTAFLAASVLLQEKIPVLAVAFTGEETAQTLARLASSFPELILGAEGVTSEAACRAACSSPLRFVAMPYFDGTLVQICIQSGVEALPTCYSPSEVASAQALGVSCVQLSFCAGLEPLAVLKEYRRSFPAMQFIPTGSLCRELLGDLIAFPSVRTVMADWLLPEGLPGSVQPEELSAACRAAKKEVLGYSFAHLGINSEDEAACRKVIAAFGSLFGFPCRDNGNSLYATDFLEVMKFKQIGTLGHIGIRTNSAQRAALELAELGMTAIPSTAKYRNGLLFNVYYQEELGGFGFHLLQRVV